VADVKVPGWERKSWRFGSTLIFQRAGAGVEGIGQAIQFSTEFENGLQNLGLMPTNHFVWFTQQRRAFDWHPVE
jgi:hypothetical protein